MVEGLSDRDEVAIDRFVGALRRLAGETLPPASSRPVFSILDDPVLHALHERVDPSTVRVPWFVEDLAFVPADDLAACQPACGGAGWRAAWLVVAQDAGDPIFLDRSDGSVATAVHGVGAWRSMRLARTCGEFLNLLTAWIDALADHGGSRLDADLVPDPTFLDGVVRRASARGVWTDGLRAVWRADVGPV